MLASTPKFKFWEACRLGDGFTTGKDGKCSKQRSSAEKRAVGMDWRGRSPDIYDVRLDSSPLRAVLIV